MRRLEMAGQSHGLVAASAAVNGLFQGSTSLGSYYQGANHPVGTLCAYNLARRLNVMAIYKSGKIG